jgi:hypothetical protein
MILTLDYSLEHSVCSSFLFRSYYSLVYISDADLCIVAGFSFRDKYISDLILQLMSTNKLIIIGEKANNGLRNLLGENMHPKDKEKESSYGIKITSIMDNNAELIPHNISKERIEDIVGTIKELMSS